MSRPFILFHWYPVSRRESILRHGLCPGKLSRDKQWRPPYVCFSSSPSLAWRLSAGFSERRGKWDLWQVWSDQLDGWETIPYDDGKKNRYPFPKEHRVYHRIPKRNIWHVGTREFKSARHA